VSIVIILIIFSSLVLYKNLISKNKNMVASTQVKGASTSNQTPSSFPSISPNPSSAPSVSLTPGPRKVGIGVVVDDYSNKSGELSSLQTELSNKVTVVSIYKQFGLPYNNNLDQGALNYIKSNGMDLLIGWEPWDPRQGNNQSTDYLSEIIKGNQDEYIKSFANQVKNYGSNVIIRFGHEMNGTWYPWGQRPSEYVQAYQRIYEVFKNEGVTNVRWMWSINASPIVNFNSYYPGESYVDIIGIDGYNYGNSKADASWVSFRQIFSQTYNYASSHPKPVYISEVASSEQGGSKAAWISDMFYSLKSMPRIEKIIWFNLNKEMDWRIQSSQSSLASFKAAI
jgi:beta-mannanase